MASDKFVNNRNWTDHSAIEEEPSSNNLSDVLGLSLAMSADTYADLNLDATSFANPDGRIYATTENPRNVYGSMSTAISDELLHADNGNSYMVLNVDESGINRQLLNLDEVRLSETCVNDNNLLDVQNDSFPKTLSQNFVSPLAQHLPNKIIERAPETAAEAIDFLDTSSSSMGFNTGLIVKETEKWLRTAKVSKNRFATNILGCSFNSFHRIMEQKPVWEDIGSEFAKRTILRMHNWNSVPRQFRHVYLDMNLYEERKILKKIQNSQRRDRQSLSSTETAVRFLNNLDSDKTANFAHQNVTEPDFPRVTISRPNPELEKWIDNVMLTGDDNEQMPSHGEEGRLMEQLRDPPYVSMTEDVAEMNTRSSRDGNDFSFNDYRNSNGFNQHNTSVVSNINNERSFDLESTQNFYNTHNQVQTSHSNLSQAEPTPQISPNNMTVAEELELEYYTKLMSSVPTTAQDARMMLHAKVPRILVVDNDKVYDSTKLWVRNNRFNYHTFAEKILDCSLQAYWNITKPSFHPETIEKRKKMCLVLYNWMMFSDEAKRKIMKFDLTEFKYTKTTKPF